jgi:uncharacterized protein (DUF779 family)
MSSCKVGPEEIPAFFPKNEDGTIPRVCATAEALELMRRLKAQHGPLLFHQSGGCCDGSSPMCFPLGDFKVGARDVCLGELEECLFYISGSQFEKWSHTLLMIDVVEGRGASFSLEIPLGVRFFTRSRVFSSEEKRRLCPIKNELVHQTPADPNRPFPTSNPQIPK